MRAVSYSPLLAAALLPTAACSPSRPTSSMEVETILAGCGIEESELVWMIDDRGSFLFGRPSAAVPQLSEAKTDCLRQWLDRENVRTGEIGYEVAH